MRNIFIRITCVLLFAIFLLSASCRSLPGVEEPGSPTESAVTDSSEDQNPVRVISAEEAGRMMNTLDSYIIVDVREQSEYDAGHIDGAVLVPVGSIGELAPKLLPDKDEVLLLYCRSGNRSARAAEQLSEMGYTNIYDFGGIIDWPYETVAAR